MSILKIKKYVLVTVILLLVVIAWSHEPAEIDIKYSAISGNLSLTVHHRVNSTSVHYINKLEIYLNRGGIELEDRLIISQTFFSQPIRNEQRAHFLVRDLNPGDKLKIVAYCNLFGKLEEVFTITERNWQEDSEP